MNIWKRATEFNLWSSSCRNDLLRIRAVFRLCEKLSEGFELGMGSRYYYTIAWSLKMAQSRPLFHLFLAFLTNNKFWQHTLLRIVYIIYCFFKLYIIIKSQKWKSWYDIKKIHCMYMISQLGVDILKCMESWQRQKPEMKTKMNLNAILQYDINST